MADLLSAASLMMTVIAILYALWYPEIIETLNIEPFKDPIDNTTYLKQAKGVFWGKSIPLSFMAVTVAAVFVVDAVKIVTSSIALLTQVEIDANYDAVKMSFVMVFLFSCTLSVYIVKLSVSLHDLIKRLS